MNIVNKLTIFGLILSLGACATAEPTSLVNEPCKLSWLEAMESHFKVADQDGHGPELGSLEWRSAIEHKLGLDDDLLRPEIDSDRWCVFIDDYVR